MIIYGHDISERVLYVAEIGINHNGNVDTALQMIAAAAAAGADAVKFQVGHPEHYVLPAERHNPRQMPDGVIVPYIEYRTRMELTRDELQACRLAAIELGIGWFASPLDVDAVAILEGLGVQACYKIASPMVTDHELLDAVAATGRPVILSSGATTDAQLDAAVNRLDWSNLAILHATSEYPCPPEHCNLNRIPYLRKRFPGVPIGYSGHEKGIPQSLAAVALGARIVERHFTLDRAMWGSDHGASLEPEAFRQMVRYGRAIEESLGDGRDHVFDGELRNMRKFRKMTASAEPVSAQ